MTLTYKVMGEGYSTALCLIDVRETNNLRYQETVIIPRYLKPEMGKVKYKAKRP